VELQLQMTYFDDFFCNLTTRCIPIRISTR
jgi:hypothetical protein